LVVTFYALAQTRHASQARVGFAGYSPGLSRRSGTESIINETTISTIEDSATAAAWISQPERHKKRARHSGKSSARGPETSDAGLNKRAISMAGASAGSLRLPRQRHLRLRCDFIRIRGEGRRLSNGCMTVNWLPRPPGSFSRLGVVTSRRLGPAVLRNRARRLLREAYRLHQDELIQPVDLVLIARPSILGRRLTDVERDLLGVLRRESLLKKCP